MKDQSGQGLDLRHEVGMCGNCCIHDLLIWLFGIFGCFGYLIALAVWALVG